MVLRKVSAFFILDFLEELSYPLSFPWRCGSIFFKLVAFYFLAQLVGASASPYLSPYGGAYYPFVMLGLALSSFQSVALTAINRKISYGMYTGTLEAMLVTPTSLSTIVFASVLYQFFSALLEIFLYVAFSVWVFKIPLGQANLTAAAVLLLLALLAHLPIGIMSAGFLLVFKRDDPVTHMLGHLSVLLGGVYFPIQVLPAWLGTVSLFIPFTHALEGLRQAVLNGWGLGQLSTQIIILGAFAVFLLPLSLATFAWAVHQAKRLGTLSQF